MMEFQWQFTATNSASAGSWSGDGGADFVLGLPDSFGRGTSSGATWQQIE